MTIKNGCDVTVKQSYGGAICQSTFTWVADKVDPLTITDLVALGAELVSGFMVALNALQVSAVQNVSMTLQARGFATPSYFRPVAGNGTWAAATTNEMPPEFAYWIRYGVDQTYESITGDEDTFHPIKRGGAFLCGVTDETLTNRIFDIPVTMATPWETLYGYFTYPLDADPVIWTPAVLGEEIIDGTGWRYAEINSAAVLRVTRLRSRLAVG